MRLGDGLWPQLVVMRDAFAADHGKACSALRSLLQHRNLCSVAGRRRRYGTLRCLPFINEPVCLLARPD